MRLRVTRDGKSEEVEVAPDLLTVSVSGRTYPVLVVRSEALRVELEIGGERVLVENWPDHFPDPPSPVDVNGERGSVTVERLSESSGTSVGPVRPVRAETAPNAASTPPSREGTPILPPMPGKVIEVRVAEGQRVEAGAVVLVLEAMKMRNEVTSPVAGVVRGLRVTPGANARAREPLMFVEPN
jgi:glutaconyl-CoA/methylmalonyl-CoA decarboxylase subunit gamma